MLFGAQLYSARDLCQTPEGLYETMKAVKEMGYASVQLSGFPFEHRQARRFADELGLHIGLTHTLIPDIINKTDEVIENHKALGCEVVGVGYPTGYFIGDTRLVDIDKMIGDLNPAAEKLEKAGLRLAYHNHWFEFTDSPDESVMEVLFNKTNWLFTFDTGWAHYAGEDVCELIRRYKDRLRFAHLKDYREPAFEGEGEGERTVALYQGLAPMTDIIKALENAGTEAAYVEQDTCPNGPLEDLRASIEALRAHGFVL